MANRNDNRNIVCSHKTLHMQREIIKWFKALNSYKTNTENSGHLNAIKYKKKRERKIETKWPVLYQTRGHRGSLKLEKNEKEIKKYNSKIWYTGYIQ